MGQKMVFFCVMAIAVSLTSTAWTEDFGSYSVATVGSDGGSGGGSYTDVRTALATYEGKTSSSTENNRQVSSEPATIPAVLKEMYGKEVASTNSMGNSGNIVYMGQAATQELMKNPAIQKAMQNYVSQNVNTVKTSQYVAVGEGILPLERADNIASEAFGYFINKDYGNASSKYQAAINIINNCNQISGENNKVPLENYQNGGISALKTGDFDLAVEFLSKAIELAPTASSYDNRGLAYAGKSQYDLAKADYQRSEDLMSKSTTESHLTLGKLLNQANH